MPPRSGMSGIPGIPEAGRSLSGTIVLGEQLRSWERLRELVDTRAVVGRRVLELVDVDDVIGDVVRRRRDLRLARCCLRRDVRGAGWCRRSGLVDGQRESNPPV